MRKAWASGHTRCLWRKLSGMKNTLQPEQVNRLLAAPTYREFSEIYISIRKSTASRNFGYADVARAGGFSARSFPRDVIKGTKRISPASLTPFIKGLGLQGDWAEYFKLLVQIQESDCRERLQEPAKLQRMFDNLTKRLRQKQQNIKSTLGPQDIFYSHHVPFVYAALGSMETGATTAQIRQRTNLENHEILPILKQLIASGIVSKVQDSYLARENHLNLTGLPANDIYKSFYLHVLSQAALNARIKFESENQLFFTSCFSVTAKNLPKLKEELRSLLLRFTDTSEVADGDKVISVAASMF